MNPRFKYRKITPREDIAEIKEQCTRDSISLNHNDDTWHTTYRDDFIRHKNAKSEVIPPPPVSINLGGGCLAPSREEMRSVYMNTYHRFDQKDVPKVAKAPPDSAIFPRDRVVPMISTAQEEMINTARGRRSEEDVQSARAMANYNKNSHYRVGYDKVDYNTTAGSSYSARGRGGQPKYNNPNLGTHIEFDKTAGPGPNAKMRSKRKWAPSKPDAPSIDHTRTNFDTGYSASDYSTTTQSGFCKTSYRPPPRAPAPAPSEFSSDAPYIPKWRTHYAEEFQHRKPIPNSINTEELRKVHWEQGYEKPSWPVHEPPVTPRRTIVSTNQNQSNIVFKGDGSMKLSTTTGDMSKSYNSSSFRRSSSYNPSRGDNIYVGSDRTDYLSTAQSATRYPYAGKPAKITDDSNKGRDCCFGCGGDWSPYSRKEMLDIKENRYVPPTVRENGAYYKQSHFDLEATSKNKSRYSTTYYKTICKPTLQS